MARIYNYLDRCSTGQASTLDFCWRVLQYWYTSTLVLPHPPSGPYCRYLSTGPQVVAGEDNPAYEGHRAQHVLVPETVGGVHRTQCQLTSLALRDDHASASGGRGRWSQQTEGAPSWRLRGNVVSG